MGWAAITLALLLTPAGDDPVVPAPVDPGLEELGPSSDPAAALPADGTGAPRPHARGDLIAVRFTPTVKRAAPADLRDPFDVKRNLAPHADASPSHTGLHGDLRDPFAGAAKAATVPLSKDLRDPFEMPPQPMGCRSDDDGVPIQRPSVMGPCPDTPAAPPL